MPYKTANAVTYDSGDFEAVMDDALARADWQGFAARKAASSARGKLRGIGIATYLEAGGGGAAPKDEVAVKFDEGGAMTLIAVTQSSGQGHETVFPQIVAQTLEIDVSLVKFSPTAPSAELVGNGTGGSRGVLGTGSAFLMLARKLIDLARPHAAKQLGVEPSMVDYADGRYSVRPGSSAPSVGLDHSAGEVEGPTAAKSKDQHQSITFTDLARSLASSEPHPLDTTAEGTFGMSYPNGCHIAEVEIDSETGVTSVERYTAVDDLGTVINPTLVAGQVHGGVMQGAGQVFGEHAVYDRETAQLLTASFSDYYMPRAGLLPDFDVHEHAVPTPTNALGAKGVGEAGCSGSLPALANAVIDALRPVGIAQLDMPFTPARVWAAIRNARPAN
jgi:carbon-monoxide dehydrogenase large subunit